jgi:hypothetical protein
LKNETEFFFSKRHKKDRSQPMLTFKIHERGPESEIDRAEDKPKKTTKQNSQ